MTCHVQANSASTASHQEDERGRKASHSHERVLIFFFLVKAKNLTSSKNTLKKKDK